MPTHNKSNVIYGEQTFSLPSHMNYGKLTLENILRGNEKVALINGATGENITYRTMAQQIVNVAASLTSLGVKRGDVVAVCSENRTEFLVTAISVFCTGATVTFINSAYNKSELLHTMEISKPSFMFFSPKAYECFYEVIRNNSAIRKFFIFGTSTDSNVKSYKYLVENYVEISSFRPPDLKGDTHTALILYSSGTTGLPKGVKLTNKNLLVSALQPPCDSANMNILTLAPWCNTVGIILTLLRLQKNQTIVYLNRFQEDIYLECIEKYKVGLLMAVPPLIVILNKSIIIKNYDISSVRLMYCGGAPLDLSAIKEAKNIFPNLKTILQGYGMTETTGAITEEKETDYKTGSVGKVVAGNIIKVVDIESREILGPNKEGEICVKGPVLFEGYVGKNLEDDLDADGFYRTGDIAYYDTDGFFYIVNRLKELIKYKAGQVSPSELEAILLQHKLVNDAGVVGMPDPIAGELPTAFVVKKSGATVIEKELIDFVASKVSSWKQLRGGVRFVNEIPKTASGKILRRVLRDLLTKSTSSKL